MPPSPPAYSSTGRAPQINGELQMSGSYAQQLPMQGVVNPLALQGDPQQQQQWSNNPNFDRFDEMDLMNLADYAKLSFDDSQMASPMFNSQMPMNYMSSGFFSTLRTTAKTSTSSSIRIRQRSPPSDFLLPF
ncbi:hypothetical protein N7523_007381 [Penicillium sp. IBT 18751x]|nr:hypothetical protein N7523_007381 [Penicillium sp. IBT 18751x]